MKQKIKTKSIEWEILEYKKEKRTRTWYFFASLFVFLAVFFSFFSLSNWRLVYLGFKANFLFALIILIAFALYLALEQQEERMIAIILGPEGIAIGQKFYAYDKIRKFAVLYKPKEGLKNLYLEFDNRLLPRLSIPLRRQSPSEIRNFLLRFLEEDLDLKDQPLSEQLTKVLKL